MPLNRQRSRKRSARRPNQGSREAGATPPAIFVKVNSWRSGVFDYVTARIQIRRVKYRYLVWYEEGKKREFYLGAVKTVPLRYRRPAAGELPPAAARRAPRAGARK